MKIVYYTDIKTIRKNLLNFINELDQLAERKLEQKEQDILTDIILGGLFGEVNLLLTHRQNHKKKVLSCCYCKWGKYKGYYHLDIAELKEAETSLRKYYEEWDKFIKDEGDGEPWSGFLSQLGEAERLLIDRYNDFKEKGGSDKEVDTKLLEVAKQGRSKKNIRKF